VLLGDLPKPLEDDPELFGVDSRPVVLDGKAHVIAIGCYDEVDLATLARELDRIPDEVGEYLQNALMIVTCEQRAGSHITRHRDLLGAGEGPEDLNRLVKERPRVVTFGRDGKPACFDAHDVDEVSDQAGHRAVKRRIRCASWPTAAWTIGSPSISSRVEALMAMPPSMFRRSCHDGQKIVARRDHLVHATPLDEQVQISLRALQGQQGSQRTAAYLSLLGQSLIGRRALLAQERVLVKPFLVDDGAFGRVISRPFEFLVGGRASPSEDIIGTLPRIGDDGIGVLFEVRTASRQLIVRLLPLIAEAAVGTLALGGRVLPCGSPSEIVFSMQSGAGKSRRLIPRGAIGRPSASLRAARRRPGARPCRTAVRARRLLQFVHCAVPVDAEEPLIDPRLTIDTFDAEWAWITATPFTRQQFNCRQACRSSSICRKLLPPNCSLSPFRLLPRLRVR
jgi:hypothetical protein